MFVGTGAYLQLGGARQSAGIVTDERVVGRGVAATCHL